MTTMEGKSIFCFYLNLLFFGKSPSFLSIRIPYLIMGELYKNQVLCMDVVKLDSMN